MLLLKENTRSDECSHEIYYSESPASLKNDCIVVCFLLEAVPVCFDLLLAFRLSEDDDDDDGEDSLVAERFWEKAPKTFFIAVEMAVEAI